MLVKKVMTRDMSSFVERYQLLYEKDPNSKVFAPLAEAYRRMGLIDEAIDLAETGVKIHPHFASGRVALGKCYVQKEKFAEASRELQIAAELSPENLLAHQLLAECYSRLKKPDLALNAYKIVLFLNPNDARIAEIVKKLELQLYGATQENLEGNSKKSDEIVEEYSMGKLSEVMPEAHKEDGESKTFKTELIDESDLKDLASEKSEDFDQNSDKTQLSLERELALLDARFERGDWVAVREQLDQLLKDHPNNQDVIQKKTYLDEMTNNNLALTEWLTPIAPDAMAEKIAKLKTLLNRVEDRRKA